MNVSVEFPAEEVSRYAAKVFDDQMPFATARALNGVALKFQGNQRERQYQVFTIRRKQFADRSVKIKPFATKIRQEVRVAVDSPGGRSDIFGKFEDQTSKTPFRGKSIAVPTTNVPRTAAGVIRKGWRPKDLLDGAAQHGVGRVFQSKGNVYRGKKKTFLVRKPGGKGTIFERDGAELLPLYQLVPRVRISPDLQFVDTANKTVNAEWVNQFGIAFDRATKTARR